LKSEKNEKYVFSNTDAWYTILAAATPSCAVGNIATIHDELTTDAHIHARQSI